MSLHSQLLDQAAHLARREPKRPLQASLRRAISAAYYALFHYLIDRATRQIFGNAANRKSLRNVLSRAFEHGSMKDASRSFASGGLPPGIVWSVAIPTAVRFVADTFIELQQQRHNADYNTSMAFTRAAALDAVTLAEQAISVWPTIEADDSAQLFLSCLLCWKSLRNR